jgi:hypothetical protein
MMTMMMIIIMINATAAVGFSHLGFRPSQS